uniref:Uncharacterized protein n=1 Tax=Nelumbo nucifera TaxID=4432 RepID=A0A822ZF40_NELNU|nr:TPA_asm: hypothetical protein HUJ06_003044 [Nelumbo nucifera]
MFRRWSDGSVMNPFLYERKSYLSRAMVGEHRSKWF